MYLFTRARTAKASHMKDAMAWATETQDLVRANTDIKLNLYSVLFGRPVGTLLWTSMVEGRATVADATARMLDNPDYLDLVERGGDLFETNGHDTFRQVIQTDGLDPETMDPPAFTQGWSAQIANGQYDHATTWAMDISKYVSELTGIGIATMTDSYGAFGTIVWIAGLESAQRVDEITETLSADAEWVKRLNYAEDLFLPGTGHVWMTRRVN